jgi:hypothetical protein
MFVLIFILMQAGRIGTLAFYMVQLFVMLHSLVTFRRINILPNPQQIQAAKRIRKRRWPNSHVKIFHGVREKK